MWSNDAQHWPGTRDRTTVGQQVLRGDPSGQVAQEFQRGQGDHGGVEVHADQPGAAFGSGEVQDKIRALPGEGKVADDLGDDLGGRRVRSTEPPVARAMS